MTIQVNDIQATFVDGKVTLKYFSVTFNAGEFPNSINGSLQVTQEDGVTIASTPDEVEAAAKKKIETLVTNTVSA